MAFAPPCATTSITPCDPLTPRHTNTTHREHLYLSALHRRIVPLGNSPNLKEGRYERNASHIGLPNHGRAPRRMHGHVAHRGLVAAVLEVRLGLARAPTPGARRVLPTAPAGTPSPPRVHRCRQRGPSSMAPCRSKRRQARPSRLATSRGSPSNSTTHVRAGAGSAPTACLLRPPLPTCGSVNEAVFDGTLPFEAPGVMVSSHRRAARTTMRSSRAISQLVAVP